MNLKKIIITLSFFLLLSCGYEPIYSKKQINNNYNFSINAINLIGDSKVNKILKSKLNGSPCESMYELFLTEG